MNSSISLLRYEAQLDVPSLWGRHREVLRTGLLIRRVEERLLELFSEGKINGTIHTCIGQELIGPCIVKELQKDDFIVSNHRGHGHYIARTGDVQGLVAELMGRTTGASQGIGGSQHLIHHKYLSNGIQGGMTPIAAGTAMANQFLKNDCISIAFIGDGTLGEGIIYETFNLCAIWQLPVLFVLENNGYAQSTCMKQTFAGNLRQRAEGFGLHYLQSNVWDLDDLKQKSADAVNMSRCQKPCLLEVKTYRLKSHSKGDDNRCKEEVLEFSQRDILSQVQTYKMPEIEESLSEIKEEVEKAINLASASPILKCVPSPKATPAEIPFQTFTTANSERKRFSELIYNYYRDALGGDDSRVVLGEDIEFETPWTGKEYGGAFKVTKDLSKLYPGRVRNTPISEAAIVGLGTGLAINGMKPTIEIMFGDFLTLALDQLLNHACKFCNMYGIELPVPLVIRTPMGGRRGYGPTHSQSIERHFMGIQNLSIIAPNRRTDPRELYASLENLNNPALVLENKVLYTRTLETNMIPGFEIQKSNELFTTIRIRPLGRVTPDVTILCYGGMLDEVEQAVGPAFDEDEVICEVICPTQIQPIHLDPIVDSIKRSKRLLIVEEGGSSASWGAEIAARLVEKDCQLIWFRRIGCNSILPCSLDAELNALPTTSDILKCIKEVRHGR